jgi:hypothetical protein
MSSFVLTVNAPGICVFCIAESSGDIVVNDPTASPVTVTPAASEGPDAASWAKTCQAQLQIKKMAHEHLRKALMDVFMATCLSILLPFDC